MAHFCAQLGLPESCRTSLERELVFQLIDFVDRHSYEFEEPEPIEPRNPEKRRPGRPVKNKLAPQQQVANTAVQPKRNIRQNLQCPNCGFVNALGGYECKRCRVPFAVLEGVNLHEPVVQACINLYEHVIQHLGMLPFTTRTKKLAKEDFQSLYTVRDKLRESVNYEDHRFIDDTMAAILKNEGPLPVERTTAVLRRARQKRQEDKSESSEDSD